MKLQKILIVPALFLLTLFPLAAQDAAPEEASDPIATEAEPITEDEGAPAAEESSPLDNLSMGLTVKAAYYPDSEHRNGATHFSPIVGAYSGLEGAVQFDANYTIPTPLGDNFLLRSANVMLTGSAELSPASIKIIPKVTFTPLPFLVFNLRGEAGTGWNFINLAHGMATWDETDKEYKDSTPFGQWFLKVAAQAIFQFDTAAVWPGDWHHIQLMYTYEIYYEYLSGTKRGQIWEWQNSTLKTNGLQEYQSLVLAYGMPLVISRAGVMLEGTRHYSADDYGERGAKFNGSFWEVSISPMAQFTFGAKKNHVLTVLFGFSSRRAYEEEYQTGGKEIDLTYSGYEWFFKRLALQYTWTIM